MAWSTAVNHVDLSAAGVSVLAGAWDISVRVAGKEVALTDGWRAVCWNSDEDGDYLELQQVVNDVIRLERQVYLSRNLKFALLADCVADVAGPELQVTSQLHLAKKVVAHSGTETRECRLQRPGCNVRIVPLHLPESRIDQAAGELRTFPDRIELQTSGQGTGLYAPLLFDWDPARRRTAPEWRTLTITEEARLLRPDVASGHRLRVGPLHLFLYRALQRSPESRSVLGHNTRDETIVAQFDRKGDVTPLLRIE